MVVGRHRRHAGHDPVGGRLRGWHGPARLSLRYAWNDREESLARALLRGIAAFFHVPLPHGALRPRDAPVHLHAVVPPG